MWKDEETHEDLLGYSVHASMLKNIILNDTMLPISIGLFGNWGCGKSSLMLQLEHELNQTMHSQNKKSSKGRILQIRFNSWLFEGYEHTKFALVDKILREISKDVKANRRPSEKLNKLLKRIKWTSALGLVFNKAKETVPFSEFIPSSEEVASLIEKEEYDELIRDCNANKHSLLISSFRNSFTELIKEAEYKVIVIYIDDLDRCAPNRIIECLEAIKLFLNVKNTAFIIGADLRIIEYAIKQHYPNEGQESSDFSPFSDYLEKLIQLPYRLPKLSRMEQETYILMLLLKKHRPVSFDEVLKKYREFRHEEKHSRFGVSEIQAICDLSGDDKINDAISAIPLMLEFLNGNPRQLKRFLNTLYIRLELAKAAGMDNIKPSILAKLMTLEYNPISRNQFEDLYTKQSKDGFIEDIEKVEEQCKANKLEFAGWKKWDSDSCRKWLGSAPSLHNVCLRDYFWISRESIDDITPIENMISSLIRNTYKELRSIVSVSLIKNIIPELCKDFSRDDQSQLSALINQSLRANPSSESDWRILNNDDKYAIVPNSLDSYKYLLMGINHKQVGPLAKDFFIRMNSNPEMQKYFDNLEFNTKLKNAISKQ